MALLLFRALVLGAIAAAGTDTMSRYSPVPTGLSLPEVERAVLDRWLQQSTFERSIARRTGRALYAFDDGPPFATGLPHYGHILTSYVKDVVPRFFTMRGYRVPRRWGWDCHGLPVEYEVEKALGLSGPAEIAALGLDRFTDACRRLVLRYAAEWERIITRLGRWVDFAHAYRTMDRSFMDSVMWAFHRLHGLGLIYEGVKVVPYCCRCQTPLSNFEARLDDAYRPRTDLSCTVRFPLRDEPGASLLAWTTTPWTLPSNVAVAVNPDLDYVECDAAGERVWVAASAAPRLSTLGPPRRVIKGRDLAGRSYVPVFPYFERLEGAFVVLPAGFVSADEGTGIVHLAPAFGEDDEVVCRDAGIAGPNPLTQEGRFTDDVTDFKGHLVFDAVPAIVQRLAERQLLFDRREYVHDYPHCWRCDQPLIYRAVGSWFVRVTAVKDRLLACNLAIAWVPEHVRDGRFGQWLEHARDWAVSRSRFWGAPIPVWRCGACGDTVVISSASDLEARAGHVVADLHRPYIDAVTWSCGRCGGSMVRVPEVLDCWFESGAMPFAQLHYPFENTPEFQATFPADFIVEYVAQTRGWFYTLHVLASALFESHAFRHAVCHGVLLGTDGRKMSKRLRNYPDPLDVVSEHGSDALRVALLSSPVVRGEDVRFDPGAAREAARRFIVPLWNTFHYFTTYAHLDGFEPDATAAAQAGALDRYLLHETDRLRSALEAAMDRYAFGEAYDAIERFIETLSGWYLRLSRARAWTSGASAEKRAHYETMHTALDHAARLLAPFLPFVTDALYQALGSAESVHLADWPEPQPEWVDEGLASDMRTVRHVVTLARSVRERLGIRHRHPLQTLAVAGVDRDVLVRHAELLTQEINVKRVTVLEQPERFVQTTVRLNTPLLGKRLKQRLAALQEAVRAGDYAIGPDGVLMSQGIALEPGEYWHRHEVGDEAAPVAAEGALVVWLDPVRDDRLLLEADARDLKRAIQDVRKRARFGYSERIVLSVTGSGLDGLLKEFGPWLMEQSLAIELVESIEQPEATAAATLSLGKAEIAVRRVVA
jgi:isoleucyl-tRNA synthetase